MTSTETAPVDGVLARTLAALALDIGRRAAALVAAADRDDLRSETKSSPTDLVTRYDRASEALIVDALSATRPDDAILGEEGSERAGTSGVRWIIDPIDGTTNFAYGFPGWAVSIGAEIDGLPAVGVVIVPTLAEEFVAWTGGGATRNGVPISVRPPVGLDQALLATGCAYDRERRARQGRVIGELAARVRDIRRMGAAAVDLCSVACGRVDAYFEIGLSPWDLAAGRVVVAEAGGLVTGARSDDVIIAAHPTLHAELSAVLDDLGAADV